MEDYVLALLILIFVVMVLKMTASESRYMPQEISQSYVSFWNPGYDIINSGGGITMVTATGTAGTSSASSAKAYSGNSGDNLLPRRDLNWYAWGVGDGSSSAQAATINVVDSVGSTVAINPNYVWGIRKELRIGGGGLVWYLLNNWGGNTGVPVLITPNGANEGGVAYTGTLYNPDIIDTFTDVDTNTYAIPNFVILKKSVKNPVAQCALNSTASGNLCICDPGWYGTGDDSSTGGNSLGCNQCPQGYWCGGQSNGTGTPPEKGQWTACPVNANYSVAGSVQAAACGLKCVSQAGGVPSTAGGTWGVPAIVLTQTADVCYCNPGYEFAVVNDPGSTVRALLGGTLGATYQVNRCKECGATGGPGSWSPGGGYYQTGSTSVTTPCTACAYGQYKHSGQLTGDNSSLQYDKTVACAGCPVGSSTNGPTSAADNCITCIGGTANNSTNQTSCPQCNAGSYSPSAGGALTCTQCTAGNYQSSPAQVSCIQCSKGSLAASPAATGCTQCPIGQWSPVAASACTPWAGSATLGRYLGSSGICPVGTQGIAGGSCSTCAVGSYNGSPGGTCANFCARNTSSPAGASACTQCPAGQSTNGTAGLGVTCSSCPGGYYSNQGGDCVACNPGYVITPGTAATNSGACTGCGAGTYAATVTSCAACVGGTYSTGAANQSCSPWAYTGCPSGYTYTPGTATVNSKCGQNCVGGYTAGCTATSTCPSCGPASSRTYSCAWASTTGADSSNGGVCPQSGLTATSTAAIGTPQACATVTCQTLIAFPTSTGLNGPATTTAAGLGGTATSISIWTIPGVIMWQAPASATYTFDLIGASGGYAYNTGGSLIANPSGAGLAYTASVYIAAGTYIYMVVGQGGLGPGYVNAGGGGGGGTFVFITTTSSASGPAGYTCILCAGGGCGGKLGSSPALAQNGYTVPSNIAVTSIASITTSSVVGIGGGAGVGGVGGGLRTSTNFTNGSTWAGGTGTASTNGGFGMGGGGQASPFSGGGGGGLVGGPVCSAANGLPGSSGYIQNGTITGTTTTGYIASAPSLATIVTSGTAGLSTSTGNGNNGRITVTQLP